MIRFGKKKLFVVIKAESDTPQLKSIQLILKAAFRQVVQQ